MRSNPGGDASERFRVFRSGRPEAPGQPASGPGPLDKDEIGMDFKVHDSYVAFSAEVVRIALLSPALFTFLAALASKPEQEQTRVEALACLLWPAICSLGFGFTFMAAAVMFGLAHRYCAIDFMATYIENRRKGRSFRGDWRLPASTFTIGASALSLALGASCLLLAVYQVIF